MTYRIETKIGKDWYTKTGSYPTAKAAEKSVEKMQPCGYEWQVVKSEDSKASS